jgi:hypothetical protein
MTTRWQISSASAGIFCALYEDESEYFLEQCSGKLVLCSGIARPHSLHEFGQDFIKTIVLI